MQIKSICAGFGTFLALSLTAVSAQAVVLVGLTDNNRLLTFNSAASSSVSSAAITGIGLDENILSIDYRNPDNQIYGLSNLGNVYKLNASTGAAVSFAAGVVPVTAGGATGASYEIDFNTQNNNLRVIGNKAAPNTNRALNMSTGVTAVQTALTRSGGPLDIVGAAYNQNFAGSAASTLNLYYIDAESDALYLNNNAFAGGVLSKVGDLSLGGSKFAVNNATGFDIAASGEAFVSWNQNLYAIDLNSGALSALGQIGAGGSSNVIGLTSVAAIPEPQTYFLLLAGLVSVAFVVKSRKTI